MELRKELTIDAKLLIFRFSVSVVLMIINPVDFCQLLVVVLWLILEGGWAQKWTVVHPKGPLKQRYNIVIHRINRVCERFFQSSELSTKLVAPLVAQLLKNAC